MKILVIADHEEKILWDYWSQETARRLSDVDLILSAGDLDADYLEFLVTMLNVPLVYVFGNHDESYFEKPPEGCVNADGRVVDIRCGTSETIRLFGLGGSMRYKEDAFCMFSEKEMGKRIKGAKKAALKDRIMGKLKRKKGIDILLTHAPCKGYGDLYDLPHLGFECFNDLLYREKPRLHVYGHVHEAYGQNYTAQDTTGRDHSGFRRIMVHPSGTTLVNADGFYVLEY